MHQSTLTPGFDYGSYHIRSLIGVGAMAEVYLADDRRTGRVVALKVMRRGFVGDDDRLRRFEREARALTATNHPNIIAVYEVGRYNRTPFIAMEYVEGTTLRELLEEGPLPLGRALDVARQMAEGLRAAHEQGIVHRDLKPDNVILDPNDNVKILDFGLSKPLSSRASADESTDAGEELTVPGTILGTLEYMSPEQASALPVDFRCDQFSFGAIVYEMLTGRVAFRGATTFQVLAAVIEGEPEPLEEDVPESLRHVVERCLRKRPGERFESMSSVAGTLRELDVAQPFAVPWLAVGGVALALFTALAI